MARVCLVKQHTTYDLFTRTGPDLRAIVASSNWRSGPLGLWEGLDCEPRVVWESPDAECQLGKRQWGRHVQGWELWPADAPADDVEAVDWSRYDAVISIDIAVPTRVVRRFPGTLWCYTWIEGHPAGPDDHRFDFSPFYGYNVFFNHFFAKRRLTGDDEEVRRMRRERRAVLDFPYYIMSSSSVERLYPELAGDERSGCCVNHHTREVLSTEQARRLKAFGPLRREFETCTDLHKVMIASKYFIIHPESYPMAGNAIIEAISAGCLVLAPRDRVWGYPELVEGSVGFGDFDGLVHVLTMLEDDPELYRRERARQAACVDEWCFAAPLANLETLLAAFRDSRSRRRAQVWAERRDRGLALLDKAARAAQRGVTRLR